MNKLQTLTDKVFRIPLLFSLLVVAGFLVVNHLLYQLFEPLGSNLLNYSIRAVLEIGLASALALWVKRKLGRGFTLGFTGRHMGKAFLLLGSFYLTILFNSMSLLSALSQVPADATAGQILLAVCSGFASGIRPGVEEELICRVCVMGYLVWMWAEKPDALSRAVWVSAFIFGLSHLNNLGDSGLAATLVQCLYATAIGSLFGAVYARTHNLLSLMVVHTMVDSMVYIAQDLPAVEKAAEIVEEAVAAPDAVSMVVYLTLTLIWGANAAFLLRKKKLEQARQLWQPLPAGE